VLVIPAIDIKQGRCVRLKQGRMSDETVFSEFPEEMALKWYEQGAERLHMVDLNGAVEGRPVNRETIRKIVDAVPIPVQLGGGIRDMKTLHAYFDLGLSFVILGTVVYKDPQFVKRAADRYPGKIILGVDAKEDRVAVEGWTEETDSTPVELVKKYESDGIAAVVYTDILRDGMRTGPNVDATRNMARAVSIPVIASGGISGVADVAQIVSLSRDGVIGMITGRALYDGSLDLAEAIRVSTQKG